ncbi:MAG: hypothetical protein ACHQHN_09420 [Sphingobacteriales bacterium]
MRLTIVFICGLFIAATSAVGAYAQQKFEKAEFYSVMKSGDVTAVDNEIAVLDNAPAKEKDGYAGALLMKKAGLVKKPKDRLKFFKQGRIKLETALMADHDNTEFHFLRLVIEEHAPKIVRYHADIEKDKALVIKNFKSLSPTVQHAILDYCANSKVLHKEDF